MSPVRLKRPATPVIALALVITGCTAAGITPPEVAALTGTVDFGARKVQAAMADVARAATVSLIDTASNTTIATTVTNAAGQFALAFGSKFKPGNAVYYLEASKGLSDNLAGHDAARLRTLARYDAGWVTITNSMPNVGIRLNLSTTALSVLASLEGTASVSPAGLLGTLTSGVDASISPSTPDTFAWTGTGITNAEFHRVYGLVDQLLANDFDPVAGVVKVADDYEVAEELSLGTPPEVLTIMPASGSIGTTVTLVGTDFDPASGGSTVTFNGTSAAVLSATTTELVVRVPSGATTGPVLVLTPAGASDPVTFTVTATTSTDIGGSFSAK